MDAPHYKLPVKKTPKIFPGRVGGQLLVVGCSARRKLRTADRCFFCLEFFLNASLPLFDFPGFAFCRAGRAGEGRGFAGMLAGVGFHVCYFLLLFGGLGTGYPEQEIFFENF